MTSEGDQIKNAVLRYVDDHPEALPDHEIDHLEQATPRRGEDDNLRIGSWLLETRHDEPVLTHRHSSGGETFRITVIHLEETDDGWRVQDVSEERHRRR